MPRSRGPDGQHEDWPARVHRLEAEVAGMRQAMRSRGLIEQAKGMLAVRLDCDPETAFQYLSELSQKQNVPVIDLAADLVGAAIPETTSTRDRADATVAALPAPAESLRPMPRIEAVVGLSAKPASPRSGRPPTALPTELARLLRRTATAMESALDLAGVTQALMSLALGGQPGTVAAVFAAEADSAVRLLASHGWSAQVVSEWQRVPSLVPTSVAAAIRSCRPLLLDGRQPHDYVLIGPGPTRAVYPLMAGADCVGALAFVWPEPRPFAEVELNFLDRLATAAAAAIRMRWPKDLPTIVDPAHQTWLNSLLETVYSSGHVLRPVVDVDGTVLDFTIAATTGETERIDGATVGRRLLDLYPNLLENGVFAGYVALLTADTPYDQTATPEETIIDGRPRRVIVNRRAARLGDSIVAAWERIDQTVYLDERLERLEALGRSGWAEWDLRANDAVWSPGLYKLLGRSGQPTTLERFSEVFSGAHRRRYRQLLKSLADGQPVQEELQVVRGRATIDVRVIGEADIADGSVRRIRLILQDISAERAAEDRLVRSESVAAARQLQLAQERGVTQALTQLLYPNEQLDLDLPRARVAGRHTVATAPAMRGDFCDAVPVGTGAMAAVGDMFGVGLAAAASVVRLRYPAMAMGAAGVAPATILSILNNQLCLDPSAPLASLLVVRFDADTMTLEWAAAGHLPPLRIRAGKAQPLKGTAGPALGLVPGAQFGGGRVKLRSNDVVLGYTNGLIDHRQAEPLQHLADRAATAAKGGLSALLALAPGRSSDDACALALQVR